MLPHLPTRAEADFLAWTFGERAEKHLLDLACGNGRHSFELVARGFNITGVDLSEEFIADAASHGGKKARFVCADMLQLPDGLAPPGGFDGAYCFGNVVGHFGREDLEAFLAGIVPLLRTGARFVVDTGMTAESILSPLPRGRWYRFGDKFMLSEHRYEVREGRLDVDYTFIHHGPPVTHRTSSFVFTLAELSRIFAATGLVTEDALATPEGDPYAVGSPRLLLVTRRA